jgi:hypothetical protein
MQVQKKEEKSKAKENFITALEVCINKREKIRI